MNAMTTRPFSYWKGRVFHTSKKYEKIVVYSLHSSIIYFVSNNKVLPKEERNMARKILELKGVRKSYGDNVILDDLNLSINENEFVTFLGPSGCGKTTTLRIIGGFESMEHGQLLLDGVDIASLPSHKRPINTVFQKYALFPHLNIYDNIAFGLRNNIYSNVYDIGTMNMMEKNGFGEEEINELVHKLTFIEKPKDVKAYVISTFESKSIKYQLEIELKALEKSHRFHTFHDAKEYIETLIKKYNVEYPLDKIDGSLKYKTFRTEFLENVSSKDCFYQMIEEIKDRHFKENVIREEVKKALKLVNLEGYEKREISSLSGGQMQRIAIARAIVNKPRILLLDEPLSALDLKLRKSMRLELRELQRKLGITFIFVTHDQEEAMVMSDTVVVMNSGKIQQMGRPEDIYNTPVNRFVATFIGEANIFRGVYSDIRRLNILNKTFKVSAFDFRPGDNVYVIIERPDFDICSLDIAKLKGEVLSCTYEENKYLLNVKIDDTIIKMESEDKEKVHDIIGLSVSPGNIYVESINESKAKLLANYENPNILEGTFLGNQQVMFLNQKFKSYVTTFIPGEIVDAVIRPEDFDIVLEDVDKAILQGKVLKTAFTGVTFDIWVEVNGQTVMVQDYQNVEVGDVIGLKVDAYEIHLMKVEDSLQPKEIQDLRLQARLMLEETEKNEKI